jgi:hypothetical protein
MKSGAIIAILVIFFLFFLPASFLYAQEAQSAQSDSEGSPPAQQEPQALTPEQNRINMDIRTSTLSELAAWARSLKLSEAGTSAELAQRIRDYYQIAERTLGTPDEKRKIIIIESARATEYFKIETVDEEYARLTGEVNVSLKDGEAVHKIRAWNILFNRTRNILTASGGVEYIKTEGDKTETFRGDSITVDIDNWSSVFLGGISERALQGDNTTYLFAGTVISRDEEDVTVLNRAAISSANNPESLWSLNASRVWLLPGSDFAILNAVLKVGEIPVMYIPFFYYPADEVIFHPVIGSRTREGNFIQTTTYILGRPKATSSTQSSLTKILGNSNDMEKKREGLFLRSTGKKAVDTGKTSLKAMLDHYVNLGTYIGLDLTLPAYKLFGAIDISAIDISLGIGLTRTLAVQNGSYTPFSSDGESDWNSSNFLSMDVPFRFRFKGSNTISGKYGSFTWSLPYYSDPFVDSDFLKRSEEMDWINIIQQGASSLEAQETTESQQNHDSWTFSGQLNPKFPNMAPYINSISIGTISSSIAFRKEESKYSQETVNTPSKVFFAPYSPSRYFFAPDTATLYQVSASVSGVPLSLGGTASRSTAPKTDEVEIEDPLKGIGIPRSPFESKTEEEARKKDTTEKLVPPVLTQRFDLPRLGSNNFSIDYRIAPQSTSILRFDSGKWKNHMDINWEDISNIRTNFRGDAGTNINLSHTEGLYSSSFSFNGNGFWGQYSYLNEDADEYKAADQQRKIANDKVQEARSSFFSTSYGTTISIKPFFRNTMFGQSNIAYNLRGIAVKSKFVEKHNSTDSVDLLKAWADNPEWELDWGDWDKDKINTHSLSANLSASIMEKTQTFTMTAELPPKDARLNWNTSLNIWVTNTTARWGMQRPEDKEEWNLDPFTFSETVSVGSYGSLSFNMQMDTEGWDSPETGMMEKRVSSLTTSLNLSKWGVSASYTANRMLGYQYLTDKDSPTNKAGWFERDNVEDNRIIRPSNFTLSYSQNITMKELWKNKINNSVNNWIYNNIDFSTNIRSSLRLDLQQYTNSSFTFSLGFTMVINKLLSLGLSAESGNSRIYQYFHDWPGFNDADINLDGVQTNLFIDLFDSFRFDDEKLRTSSGFKMKSFRITATHHLGDWNAILNWSMLPYLPTGSQKFEINNEVSFLLQWIPISEIKSDIKYNKKNSPEWEVKGL